MIKTDNMSEILKYKQKNIIQRFFIAFIGFFKRWNWTAYFFILIFCLMGAMANKNCASLKDAFILGLIGGNIFGLTIAWVTISEIPYKQE